MAGTCCVMQWTPPPPRASVVARDRDDLAARVEPAQQRQRLVVGLLARAPGRSARRCRRRSSCRAPRSAARRGRRTAAAAAPRPPGPPPAAARRSRAWCSQFGLASSATVWSSTCPGAMKAQMLSTWPSVSSSSTSPCPSQTTVWTPSSSLQPPRDLVLRQLRVALRVQQALLGGDQRALAVDGDRAALEDQVAWRRCAPPPSARAARAATSASSSYGRNFSPQALKPKSTPARRPVAVEHEDRARVAHPRVVDRDLGRPRRPRRTAARAALAVLRAGDHRHRLEGRDRVGDLGVVGLGVGVVLAPTSPRAPASP